MSNNDKSQNKKVDPKLLSAINNANRKVSSKEPLPPITRNLTEEDLIKKRPNITPDDVLKLNKFTNGYLCDPEDNIYDIEFVRFKIRDPETNVTYFEVSKPPEANDQVKPKEVNRFVRYQFNSGFLFLKTIGTTYAK